MPDRLGARARAHRQGLERMEKRGGKKWASEDNRARILDLYSSISSKNGLRRCNVQKKVKGQSPFDGGRKGSGGLVWGKWSEKRESEHKLEIIEHQHQ